MQYSFFFLNNLHHSNKYRFIISFTECIILCLYYTFLLFPLNNNYINQGLIVHLLIRWIKLDFEYLKTK